MEPQRFEFLKGRNIKQRVVIDASPQTVERKKRLLTIIADPLPRVEIPPPPKGKRIVSYRLVMEPRVRLKGTVKELHDFDPPLAISIDFTAADVSWAERDSTGKPILFIITCYKDDQGKWRWQRLRTSVSFNADGGGTLTAKIKTLRPGDPVGEGSG